MQPAALSWCFPVLGGAGGRRPAGVPQGRMVLLSLLRLFAVELGGRQPVARAALRETSPGLAAALRSPGGPVAAAAAPRGGAGRGSAWVRPRLPLLAACAAMAGALSGMFGSQPPGPPPPGPPGGPGPAGLIPPPTGPRNPNNTLVDELEASFEVRGRGGEGAAPPWPSHLRASLSRRPASPRW